MRPCPECHGDPGGPDARWCGRCGAALGGASEIGGARRTRRVAWRRAIAVLAVPVVAGAVALVVRAPPTENTDGDVAVSLPVDSSRDAADNPAGGASPSPGLTPSSGPPVNGREPTSRPVWSATVPGWVNGSVVTSAGVLVRTTARVALVGEDGGTWSQEEPVGLGVNGRPLVAEDAVLVGSYDGRLSAFELATGRPRWQRRHTVDARRSPVPFAVSDGIVAVWTPGRGLAGVTLSDGDVVWRRALDVFEVPRHGDGDAAYAVVGHDLVSIDIATGAVRWSFRDVDGRRLSRLAVGARHVVVFAGLDVVALDADTGKVTWRVAGETAVSGRPVAVAATVAIPEARGHGTALVGRSLETGIERWRLPLPRFTTVTAGRRAFIAVTSGDSVRVVDPAAGGVVLEVRPGDISVVEAVWTPDALVVAGTRLDGTRLQAYALPAQASLGTGSLVR